MTVKGNLPDQATEAPVAEEPPFNVVDYLRRLNFASVEIQRLRSSTTQQHKDQLTGCLQSLSELVAYGMSQAKSIKEQAQRDEFVEQMRKTVASSHVPLKTATPTADPQPAKPVSAVKPIVMNEAVFQNRLPRFMKKWKEGDPEWRLLECAVRSRNDEVFVIGLAQTNQQNYSLFHGNSGGEYKAQEMSLHDAQKVMTTAYQRGYTAVPVKVLASRTDVVDVAKSRYDIVRMTNAVPATAPNKRK